MTLKQRWKKNFESTLKNDVVLNVEIWLCYNVEIWRCFNIEIWRWFNVEKYDIVSTFKYDVDPKLITLEYDVVQCWNLSLLQSDVSMLKSVKFKIKWKNMFLTNIDPISLRFCI